MADWLTKCIPFLSLYLLIIISAETSSIDGPSMRLPFRLKGRQPEWCGHNSWFDLSCTESNHAVLELPFSFKALVKSINYASQLITVSYPKGCLHTQITNFNLSASPFRFNDKSVLHEYALFNCSGMSHSKADNDYFMTSGSFSCLNVPGFEVVAVNSRQLIIDTPLLSCTSIHSLVVALFFVWQEHW